jgi:predicted Fe-S protein YdhL (DUF1289 family)
MFAGESQNAMSIQTPCTKICTIDPACGLCTGCGRTLDEIARWSTLTDDERTRVMAELPRRMGRLAAVPQAAADHVRGMP